MKQAANRRTEKNNDNHSKNYTAYNQELKEKAIRVKGERSEPELEENRGVLSRRLGVKSEIGREEGK